MAHGGARPGAGRPRGSKGQKRIVRQSVANEILSAVDEKKCWMGLLASADERIRLESLRYLSDRVYGKAGGRLLKVPFTFLLPATVSFRSVLDLRLLHRLPLHIRRIVSAATFERNDVIHDVAFPPFRVTGSPHELGTCRGAALDLAVATSFGDAGFCRNR